MHTCVYIEWPGAGLRNELMSRKVVVSKWRFSLRSHGPRLHYRDQNQGPRLRSDLDIL